MRKIAIISSGLVFVLGTLGLGQPGPVLADDGRTYPANFTCGSNPNPNIDRIVPGQYGTVVGIHNGRKKDANLAFKVLLTFPAVGDAFDPPDERVLPAGQAVQIACDEITASFPPPQQDVFPPYTQGFLVIVSSRRVNVTATYTVAEALTDGSFAVKSEDVESVPAQR